MFFGLRTSTPSNVSLRRRRSIVAPKRNLRAYASSLRSLFVCGGGARNAHVLRSLAKALPGVHLSTTDELGVPVDQVEAVAFAWLAQRMLARQAGNLPPVTGARGPRVLGALYPK